MESTVRKRFTFHTADRIEQQVNFSLNAMNLIFNHAIAIILNCCLRAVEKMFVQIDNLVRLKIT